MTDYKEWVSRFMDIYRFSFKGEIERVNQAIEYLEETKPSKDDLDKIWSAQVEHNIFRRKQLKQKLPVKRDTSNLYRFFKERLWDRMIPSTEVQNEVGFISCCECGLSRPARERGWVVREEKIYCTPCWGKKYEDGPTGINVLRQAYKNRVEQRPGETGHSYIARIFGTGKKRSVESDKPEVGGVGGVPVFGPEDDWQAGKD